jgi:hypothetical protein
MDVPLLPFLLFLEPPTKKCERGEDSSLADLECLTCKRNNSFASFHN